MILYIANRGEIARRIIRTAKRMKIKTVVGYADQDRDLPFVSEADEAFSLNGEESLDTYLHTSKIFDICKRAKVTHLHPGYGFLSENAKFAQACQTNGIEFVGPPPKAMQTLGDKIGSRHFLRALGTPLLPSYEGEDQSDERLLKEAEAIQFPVLIKPSAGGGGKGMQKVLRREDFFDALASSKRIAQSAFGDDRVFLERWVEPARHIEVQIVGDRFGNILTFGERECSLQRRHQKVIEETPCLSLSHKLRKKILDASSQLAREAGYYSAGTVEWVWDGNDGIYFLEVNARLQVEHPVTEMVWGVDLVELQLRVAQGENLAKMRFEPKGHAIEARLCAEDPAQNFIPSGGKIHRLILPNSVRVDFGFREKNVVPSQFDSMLGKIIAFEKTRPEAIGVLSRALSDLVLFGPTTNRAYLVQILRDHRIQKGEIYTTLLGEIPAQFQVSEGLQLVRQLRHGEARDVESEDDLDFFSPWGAITGSSKSIFFEDFGEKRYFHSAFADWTSSRPRSQKLTTHAADQSNESDRVLSPMPAKVVRVLASVGALVKKGDLLVVVEAMKMEHQLKAARSGKIRAVTSRVGDRVGQDQVLIEFDSEDQKNESVE